MSDKNHLMRRNILIGMGAALTLPACETLDPAVIDGILGGPSGAGFGLSQADADLGIRTALNNGVSSAIGTIGVLDGFWRNDLIKIALPNQMQGLQNTFTRFGAGGLFDELHQSLNRGAEKAVPVAKDIFVGAISQMSIQDAIAIVRGPNTVSYTHLTLPTKA